MSSTSDAGPAINRHCRIGVSLYSVDTPPPTESTVQCWMVDGQSRRRWTSVKPALGWGVVFAGHCVVDQLAADTGPQWLSSKHGLFTQCCFNVVHRLWRWPKIETALSEWPVFAGILAINLLAAEGETSLVFVYKNGESCSYYSMGW